MKNKALKQLEMYTRNLSTETCTSANKGITLIALVITIIILLILAGITIAILGGEDGLINRAKQVATTSKEAAFEEELQLVIYEIQTEFYSDNTTTAKNEKEYLQAKCNGEVISAGNNGKIKENGEAGFIYTNQENYQGYFDLDENNNLVIIGTIPPNKNTDPSQDNTKPTIYGVTSTKESISFKVKDLESGISGYSITKTESEPTSWTETSGIIISITEQGLEEGETYYIWVKDGNNNVSYKEATTLAPWIQSSMIDSYPEYMIIEVFGSYGGADGAKVHEIELYDSEDKKINYTTSEILNVYDSTRSGSPKYWMDPSYGIYQLMNGVTNVNGGYSCVLMHCGSTGNNPNLWCRLLIKAPKPVAKAIVYTGVDSAPYGVKMYSVNSYSANTYNDNVRVRSDNGLTKLYECIPGYHLNKVRPFTWTGQLDN